MKETFVDILGMHVLEPVTVLTNIILTIFCIYFYYKLDVNTERKVLGKYWRLFFLFFGLNAFIGAVAHGFKGYFSPSAFYYLWLCMNLASIPITYYLLRANIELSKFSEKNKKMSKIIVLALSLFFVALTIVINNFVIVKINALIAILVTIVRHYRTYKNGQSGSGYIAFGFAFSILALIVHGAKLSLSDWFNFKDISHVIMNISLYIIFIGVLLKLRLANGKAETEKI